MTTPASTQSSQEPADYPFWCEEKLRNADTDLQGHVNNAVMATFFEAGRIEVLNSPEIQAVTSVLGIVVARLAIDYKKELFFPGKVRVGSRVTRVGRTSFTFSQTLVALDSEVARAEAVCVLIDHATRQPSPVSDSLRHFLLNPLDTRYRR
jgi:acyl-CoA thioester hydrolase